MSTFKERAKKIVVDLETCNGASAIAVISEALNLINEFANEPDSPMSNSAPMYDFVERVSKQLPEKPDHWSSCGQCEHNINDAEELLANHDMSTPLDQWDPSIDEDSERLDWLEDQIKNRGIYGVSFDYVNHVEDGQVIDRGFRILWRKFLGQRKTSLRAAIDSAMENDDMTS